MVSRGLKQDNTFQEFPGLVAMYPKEYFCPINPRTRKVERTANTATIHHFMASWEPKTPVSVSRKWMMRLFGEDFYQGVRRLKLKIFPKPWK